MRGTGGALGGVAVAAALSALALCGGCARERPEIREARLAAQRYLNALARKNLEEIRARSTCVVSMQFIRGGNVLKIGAPKQVRLGGLDSLSKAAADSDRAANERWMRAPDADRAAYREAMQHAGLADVIYRNAIRAVRVSRPDTLLGSDAVLETRTLRVRVRYAGSPVGPQAVDREQILRMIRAPAGKWIAFSFYTVEDDPKPDGI